jgi:gamma-glutamylcyclotransferase (GGCT)/AIG2-like uncharacterized protein YtfP
MIAKVLTLKERISRHISRNNSTWDIPDLERFDGHYVLVYGTLKFGHSRHSALSFDPRCKFQGIFSTLDASFEMVNTQFGFPVVLQGTGHKPGRIKGELWFVPSETIMYLDKLESNGKMFERDVFPVQGIRSGDRTETLEAYMYVGRTKFWAGHSDKFLDLEPRGDKNSQYYFYRKEDTVDFDFKEQA